MDAVVLFFVLGAVAGLAKSDLKLPPALYDALSIYLLLAIGLKGGVELAKQPFAAVAPQALMAMSLGVVIPLIAFPVLRGLGRLGRADAASMAAHYGSVSVVTFAVGQNFLQGRGIVFEAHMPLFLVLLEVPGILVGVLLARVGTISALRSIQYWSTTEKKWGPLSNDASALTGPDSKSRRRDFLPSELVKGADLYYWEDDVRTGPEIYRLRVSESASERFVVSSDNVTPIRRFWFTLFKPGALQSGWSCTVT